MNVVDSCGWLEFMGGGSNSAFFELVLLNEKELLIPGVVVFEVCKRLRVQGYHAAVEAFLSVAERCHIAHLGPVDMAHAAKAGIDHKLALADAIIWQTAQTHQARLYTQEADLAGKPGVIYQSKALQNSTLTQTERPKKP